MSINHKQTVKANEPMVYDLAVRMQAHLELSWVACVLIAREMLAEGWLFVRQGGGECPVCGARLVVPQKGDYPRQITNVWWHHMRSHMDEA